MADIKSPLMNPDGAAHEIVVELIRAGRISSERMASEAFTLLLDHYSSEMTRIENKEQ